MKSSNANTNSQLAALDPRALLTIEVRLLDDLNRLTENHRRARADFEAAQLLFENQRREFMATDIEIKAAIEQLRQAKLQIGRGDTARIC